MLDVPVCMIHLIPRMNGTDLYNFAYFISGPDEAQEKLKDPGAAKALKQRITLPKMQLNGYLRARARGYVPFIWQANCL